MLFEAFESLTNPCLPPFFQDYPCLAAAIALAGLFITQCIQSFAGSALDNEDRVEVLSDIDIDYTIQKEEEDPKHQGTTHVMIHEEHIRIHPHHHFDDFNDRCSSVSAELFNHDEDDHHHALILNSKRIGVYMLELGIASHSIIIGLALGTTRGEEEFTMLLAAICLHQFFVSSCFQWDYRKVTH
jgi:zinc transporter 1/2/3